MNKNSKVILPLMAAMSEMNINDYDSEVMKVLESFDTRYTEYKPMSVSPNVKSKKQLKARKKNKAAKQSRKKNRK